METTVGLQRFTANGVVTPSGSALRLYSLDFASSVSSTHITLWNGIDSSSAYQLMIRLMSDSQGTAHNEWVEGIPFSSGIYLNTSSGNCVVLVGYRKLDI